MNTENSRSDGENGSKSRLSESDRHRLLVEWNATSVTFPRDATIVSLFEDQAQRTPDAVAVVLGAKSLSYRELDSSANRVAHKLSELGVGSESLVGLSLERSIESIVGVLGILKAGGAYVPLDPAYPRKRIEFMLTDTAIGVLITDHSIAESFPTDGLAVLQLDRDLTALAGVTDDKPPVDTSASNLAYVMYTSGSTGQPKGTCIEHRSVVRLVRGADYTAFGPDQVVLALAPISFDASTFELWGPLLNGGRCVIYPDRVPDGQQLADLIDSHGVTDLFLTTALFNTLVDTSLDALRPLKCLLTGGEAHSMPHIKRALAGLPDTRLVHVYGPTETTTFATAYEVPVNLANDERAIPIGKPIANTTTYVLDPGGDPVPIGATGELYIGGDGVARGYLNRPELTREKFVPDSFGQSSQSWLYRTGDLVFWRPNGTIQFVGREDHQVKVHGFRIELGEIEAALRSDASVNETIVVVREDLSGEKRVVAYVVAAADLQPTVSGLRDSLKSSLPEYMIPSAFVMLDSLPLTPNGKVDRSALPAPGSESIQSANAVSSKPKEFEEPQTPTEIALAAMFSELLGVRRVGLSDDFFELGGHSIKAIQLAGRIREHFGVPLSVDRLFDLGTVAAITAQVERALRGETDSVPRISPRSPAPYAPTSFAQRRIWFIQHLDPENLSYNYQGALRFIGSLDIDLLARCLTEIVRRHEIYRSTFLEIDGEPVQQVCPPWSVELEIVDLTDRADAERIEFAQQLIHRRGREPYDMTKLPLVKWFVIRLGDSDHILAHLEHHIVHDGWSLNVLLHELVELYRAYATNSSPNLPELELQFADYAAWERRWLDGDVLREGLEYWQKQLANCPELLDLPTDRPRTARQTHDGSIVQRRLSATLAGALRDISRAANVTLFMTMQAAFALLLGRLARQTDVCIGAGIANRHWQTENLIGMFINNVVLRHDLSGVPSFATLQSKARTIVRDAHRYQYVPFEKVVQQVNATRSQGHNPLYQVMFSFHDAPLPNLDLPNLSIRHQELVHNGTAKFDLNVISIPRKEQRTGAASDGGDEIDMFWEYNSNLFDHSTIEKLAQRFESLLEAVSADPSRPISDLAFLDESERHLVIEEWNDTATGYPREANIVQLFESEADHSPEAVALVYGDQSLSYAELDRRANCIARHLRDLGVEGEHAIGVLLNRSLEYVVAILAVLKAGGAYVPLDSDLPDAQLREMLAEAGARLVLTREATLERLSSGPAELVAIENLSSGPDERLRLEIHATQLACVIFTSGATREPKGVCVEHRNVIQLVRDTDLLVRDADDVFLQISPVSHGASLLEIWAPLLNGGRLAICPPGILSPDELGDLIQSVEATSMYLSSHLFAQAVDEQVECLRGLRQLVTGGEVLSSDHARKFLESQDGACALINSYGPAEATAFSTRFEIRSTNGISDIIPLGRPIANARIYILDPNAEPLPRGSIGEIYIGGDGVTRGYVDEKATSDRFLSDPFVSDDNARMYRTGDWGRWLEDGTIEFVGREEDQVKVGGFRIEVAKVESVLRTAPGVSDAIVVARELGSGEKKLVAYISGDADRESLRQFFDARMPEYMRPSVFVMLERLPRSPGGKVIRGELPIPEHEPVDDYLEPRTAQEKALAAIFLEVLGVERVGVNDDFFALGGHSLQAMRIVARMRDALGADVRVQAFFDEPTIAGLISHIEAGSFSRPESETFEL